MAFFKELFTRRSDKKTEERKEVQKSVSTEAPQPAAKAGNTPVTTDMIVESIETCKAALSNFGLTKEDVDKYCTAFIAMQQAVQGLHSNLDVSDLMEYLYQVFTSAMFMIFSGGTALDRDKAIKTANDAIRTIPSTADSSIKIATLQLAILLQSAMILTNRRTIADLLEEKAQYLEAEKELMRNSGAKEISELSELDRLTFDQYEQQITGISEQVKSAERLIATYNQEIVALKGIIRSIEMNPGAVNVLATQEKMQALREKMPTLTDFTNMVEKATRNAEETRAKIKAQIKELSRKLEDTVYVPDPETEMRMSQVMAEIQAENQKEEVQETPQQTEETEAAAAPEELMQADSAELNE